MGPRRRRKQTALLLVKVLEKMQEVDKFLH